MPVSLGWPGSMTILRSDEQDGVVGEALSHGMQVSSNMSYSGAADGDPRHDEVQLYTRPKIRSFGPDGMC